MDPRSRIEADLSWPGGWHAPCEEDEREVRMLRKLFGDESGAASIEYGLIAALVSIAIIAALSHAGTAVSTSFRHVAAAVDTSSSSSTTSRPSSTSGSTTSSTRSGSTTSGATRTGP
jgi:pilus assembly protein Flp/PilA